MSERKGDAFTRPTHIFPTCSAAPALVFTPPAAAIAALKSVSAASAALLMRLIESWSALLNVLKSGTGKMALALARAVPAEEEEIWKAEYVMKVKADPEVVVVAATIGAATAAEGEAAETGVVERARSWESSALAEQKRKRRQTRSLKRKRDKKETHAEARPAFFWTLPSWWARKKRRDERDVRYARHRRSRLREGVCSPTVPAAPTVTPLAWLTRAIWN